MNRGYGLSETALHRIRLALLIRSRHIHFLLLGLPILEELLGNCREQSVAQHILILLDRKSVV